MKRYYVYAALFAFALTSCVKEDLGQGTPAPVPGTEVKLPANAEAGELLIKFKPEMSGILDRTFTRAMHSGGGAMTRSGIPSTDEVLEILGGYHFERVFPRDERTEERTREAGLHLWYKVKFDEDADLQQAARKLSLLGEISAVQGNPRIKRAYDVKRTRTYVSEAAARNLSAARATEDDIDFSALGLPFTADPALKYQWHYYNTGDYSFAGNNPAAKIVAGCDVNCVEAWKMCTGDPSIIVAVLDEGVMYTHPDLEANMWKNDGEAFGAGQDADGNGYVDDVYGYNFVTNSGAITWAGETDAGHGTHVAGTIAAVNGNGRGVCGIAGGSNGANGVKIMTCQVFEGENGATLDGEAKAIKYAADNGAVILQCSWGYVSAEANKVIFGTVLGPATEEEWEKTYPLEKEALDYFIQNAGSPNGVIEGGIAVFAGGNEYAALPSFPGAYSKCVTVGALDAAFTPSSFTNYGAGTDVSAPGGDAEYYGIVGQEDPEGWFDGNGTPVMGHGSILSTWVSDGQAAYGYMDGTSMACPHVSGVAALGLSYAVQKRRHFKADEFVALLKESVKEIDPYLKGSKLYYYTHNYASAPATKMDLGSYRGKLGTGLVDAAKLLKAVEGGGLEMKVPNMYVSVDGSATLDLAFYFENGRNLSYTVSVADAQIAKASVAETMLTVEGIATGSTKITVKPSSGQEQTLTVTVRKNAGEGGWM
ncbi:MAG: S8 family serine peptidase [Alistipes sp.]|nr:S8 family serine peptidase [Alistipes sp.]